MCRTEADLRHRTVLRPLQGVGSADGHQATVGLAPETGLSKRSNDPKAPFAIKAQSGRSYTLHGHANGLETPSLCMS